MKIICLDEETIAGYIDNLLPENKRAEVETHLSSCRQCMEEVIAGKDLAMEIRVRGSEPAPKHVTEAAVRMVTTGEDSIYKTIRRKASGYIKKVLSDTAEYMEPLARVEMAPVPVRGPETDEDTGLVSRKITFSEISAHVDIERIRDDRANIRVELDDFQMADSLRATLIKNNEREVSSYIFSEKQVVFEDIPFGHYKLVFEKSGIKIGSYYFVLKETGNEKQ